MIIPSFSYESIEESEKQHKQEEEKSRTLKSNKNNRGANVMIIDDEPDALLSLKAFLENKPYSVEVFSTARERCRNLPYLVLHTITWWSLM